MKLKGGKPLSLKTVFKKKKEKNKRRRRKDLKPTSSASCLLPVGNGEMGSSWPAPWKRLAARLLKI